MSSQEDEATKQGNSLREKGDFDGAIAAYTEAVRLNPENAQPYSSRGQAYLRKGEVDKAIADCNRARELDPMMAEAYCCRGYAYHKKGEFDKAVADYEETVRLDPKQAVPYYTRVFLHQAGALRGFRNWSARPSEPWGHALLTAMCRVH